MLPQVVNRLLMSGSPLLYWMVALVTAGGGKKGATAAAHRLSSFWFFMESPGVLGDLLLCFCLSFIALGFLFYPNRLPWT